MLPYYSDWEVIPYTTSMVIPQRSAFITWLGSCVWIASCMGDSLRQSETDMAWFVDTLLSLVIRDRHDYWCASTGVPPPLSATDPLPTPSKGTTFVYQPAWANTCITYWAGAPIVLVLWASLQ